MLPTMHRRVRGFSLIELLVAVAIVGIVAAIALPAYDSHVRRSHRAAAKALLSEVASRQESFFLDRKAYAGTLTELGYEANTMYVGNDGQARASADGARYAVTITAAGVTRYTIQASARGGQSKDVGCTTLTLDQAGSRTPATGDCWSR